MGYGCQDNNNPRDISYPSPGMYTFFTYNVQEHSNNVSPYERLLAVCLKTSYRHGGTDFQYLSTRLLISSNINGRFSASYKYLSLQSLEAPNTITTYPRVTEAVKPTFLGVSTSYITWRSLLE